ncbi:MAG: hypothetical protein FJX76_21280 [Armatimonadetes bacterium]|nr:hypothetical protein [Armatimonadota bacterium]
MEAGFFRWERSLTTIRTHSPTTPQTTGALPQVRLHRPLRAGGPDVLLILLPGAGLGPEAYDDLVRSLQQQSSERLWVAVPGFPFNTPAPVGAAWQMRQVLNRAESAAGVSFPAERRFLAGHSLGGVVAQQAAQEFECGGVVLLGAYLAHGVSGVPTAPLYPRPVLTVGGEVDGLTRVTRVAEAWKEGQGTPETPVVVLPGVNHAAFADGRILSDDLPAETTLADAHNAIAGVVDDFLAARAGPVLPQPEREAAQARLDAAVRDTSPMVEPFLQARAGHDQWVARAARASLGVSTIPGARFEVRPKDQEDTPSLALSRPALRTENGGQVVLEAPYLEAPPINPLDISTIPVSGTTLAIKMKSPSATARALGTPLPALPAAGAVISQEALDLALASVTPSQRARYLAHGRPLAVLPDRAVSSGLTWVASSVLDREAATVASSVLDTGPDLPLGLADLHYVSVLPPDAAIEWVLVDGLRQR